MIRNEKKGKSLPCSKKKLSTLLRGLRSKDVDFHCLNCLKLKCHEKICKNKDFCVVVMPSESINIRI